MHLEKRGLADDIYWTGNEAAWRAGRFCCWGCLKLDQNGCKQMVTDWFDVLGFEWMLNSAGHNIRHVWLVA